MNRLLLCLLTFFGGMSVASAQYPSAAQNLGDRPLPPFLASMERHTLKIVVKRRTSDGQLAVAPKDLRVGLSILAGASKVRDYKGKTDAAGTVTLHGIPSNPKVQGAIQYKAWVDFQGVRYPFMLEGVPQDGSETEFVIEEVSTDLSGISAVHSIELLADEESLVARHIIRLYNDTSKAINLGALPGGGMALPCPEGAKHPELHDDKDKRLEVRGTKIIYKGALLPSTQGPTIVNFVYTVPYSASVFEWRQTLPVKVRGVSIAAPQFKLSQQREAVPLTLLTRGEYGAVKTVQQQAERSWSVLRSDGQVLEANQTLHFAIGNLPEVTHTAEYLLLASIGVVILVILFGFRRQDETAPERLSLSHLEAERDRLVKALARMRKAQEKGRISSARFEREQEAITARLVTLYRTIDQLKYS